MDKLAEDTIRNFIQDENLPTHRMILDIDEITELMQSYHEAKLKEELLKFLPDRKFIYESLISKAVKDSNKDCDIILSDDFQSIVDKIFFENKRRIDEYLKQRNK